ncbi:sulfite exporter TauE/SafE family protein [Striga asiatica]|uniref:Sulfite exporter TauE/SafE family protein n=1 Tax=Striga asiatica TaxID=4170 RepID=A0A5A7QJW4_STRAF|nr:sulfite exporter TauE/SafE family protein [Striga asiatica]
MAVKGLVVYLLTGFSLALLSVHFVNNRANGGYEKPFLLSSSDSKAPENKYGSESKSWPELEFSWRIVLATVIGFLGSACGTVGGVGGGGIFVPMLTLIVGFDTKSAAAISKCMIMGASASSVWYNLRVPHPCRDKPILDYDLALLFQPMLMLGITLGVSLSVVFPYWLITVLIIILFLGTSSRSFAKAIEMWKEETMLKKSIEDKKTFVNSRGESYKNDLCIYLIALSVLIDADYELLVPREEKTPWNDMRACSTWYWILTLLQLPVAFGVFLYECVKLYKENKKRRIDGNPEQICEAAIDWTGTNLAFCALCGIIGGTVGGLLGSGGGFVLGPLLLEFGVIPQVFEKHYHNPYRCFEITWGSIILASTLYLMAVSILAGFWGQFFIRKMIAILKRASLIVFVLSGVIFASALTMGVVGIERSIKMINNHEFMGFLDFCSSQ